MAQKSNFIKFPNRFPEYRVRYVSYNMQYRLNSVMF